MDFAGFHTLPTNAFNRYCKHCVCGANTIPVIIKLNDEPVWQKPNPKQNIRSLQKAFATAELWYGCCGRLR